LIIFILSYIFVLPTSFLRIPKTHNRTSLQLWHANALYIFSFCKPSFSGATREWDALYNLPSLTGHKLMDWYAGRRRFGFGQIFVRTKHKRYLLSETVQHFSSCETAGQEISSVCLSRNI
jgi:hypothetical protein